MDLRTEYHDRQEATTTQRKLGEVEYKGDIKAYLTEFRALNIYARCTGESLMEKFNLAMPQAIIDMRLAYHIGEFVDNEHFLVATYNVGIHVEQKKALEELRGKWKEGGKDEGKKNQGRDREGQAKGKGSKRLKTTS